MNGKKAKQLRKECLGIPVMKHVGIEVDRARIISTKTSKGIKRHFSHQTETLEVNHYHNAKKLYKRTEGTLQAANDAIRFATLLEERGVYQLI